MYLFKKTDGPYFKETWKKSVWASTPPIPKNCKIQGFNQQFTFPKVYPQIFNGKKSLEKNCVTAARTMDLAKFSLFGHGFLRSLESIDSLFQTKRLWEGREPIFWKRSTSRFTNNFFWGYLKEKLFIYNKGNLYYYQTMVSTGK